MHILYIVAPISVSIIFGHDEYIESENCGVDSVILPSFFLFHYIQQQQKSSTTLLTRLKLKKKLK